MTLTVSAMFTIIDGNRNVSSGYFDNIACQKSNSPSLIAMHISTHEFLMISPVNILKAFDNIDGISNIQHY